MNPFLDVAVQPSYGHNDCAVRWKLLSGYEAAKVYVYRSEDGITGWELLNGKKPVVGSPVFVDHHFVIRNLETSRLYRLLLVYEGEEHDSPVVGIFDKLTRREFGIVRRLMQLLMLSMDRGRQGIRVKLLRKLMDGKPCPKCTDSLTGQAAGTSLCRTCYGTKWVGGYAPPVDTWIRAERWSGTSKEDSPDGKGRTDKRSLGTLALCIPEPSTDDLIINPVTDERFGVGPVHLEYFRGVIPTWCSPELSLIPRSDVRYQLPLEQVVDEEELPPLPVVEHSNRKVITI